MESRNLIQDFLGQGRMAMIGVSRNPKHYSRMVFKALRQQGYEVVPVNPEAGEIDGERCYAKIGEVDPQIYTVLILTPPALTDTAVRDCAEAGVHRIWIRRTHDTAEEFCRRQSIDLISGECPLMFLNNMEWPHRLHGWIRHAIGTYPA